jgi:hypothetical protein
MIQVKLCKIPVLIIDSQKAKAFWTKRMAVAWKNLKGKSYSIHDLLSEMVTNVYIVFLPGQLILTWPRTPVGELSPCRH